MRIGVDARTMARPTSGVGIYVSLVLTHMGPSASEDEFVLFHDSPSGLPRTGPREGSEIPPERGARCEEVYLWSPGVRRIAGGNLGAAAWLSWALPRAVKSRKIDVLFCPNFFVPDVRDVRRVAIIHDLAPLYLPSEHYSKMWLAYFRTMLPRSVERADIIITPSEYVRKDVIGMFDVDKERVIAINNAPQASFFIEPNPESMESTARKYGLNEQSILFVGQNNHRKNLVTLLRAVACVKERSTFRPKLIACGSRGSASDETEREIRQLGLADDVILTGSVSPEELRCLYRLATIVAMPSLDEGFCLPVLEGMASGTPVICSNRGALPDTVGDAAIVLDAQDVEVWVDAIWDLLQNESCRTRMSEEGIRHAREFTWEKTADKTIQVLKSAVSECGERRKAA